MELSDVARRRRMVRNYTDQPVSTGAIERIVDAGIRAPSAGFSQGQRFVIVTDDAARMAVAHAAGEDAYIKQGFDPWISKAPVHVVICADKQAYLDRYDEPDKDGTEAWDVPYWWVDAGASMMAILYAAVDEGLAAGFLGAHAFEGLQSALGIPAEILIVGVVTIGHAAPDRRSESLKRGRTRASQTTRWNHW